MGKKKSTVQDALMLTDKGYRDLKKSDCRLHADKFLHVYSSYGDASGRHGTSKTVYRREHLMDKYVDLFRTRHHRRSNRISLQQKRL